MNPFCIASEGCEEELSLFWVKMRNKRNNLRNSQNVSK